MLLLQPRKHMFRMDFVKKFSEDPLVNSRLDALGHSHFPMKIMATDL